MLSLSILLALSAASKPVPSKEAVEQEESAKPIGSPGAWVMTDDYPVTAIRDGREGTTGFQLTVGADGLPTRCEIVASSGHADLDAKTCEVVMQRARFTPGHDAKGRAIGGTYTSRVRWQIPDGYSEALADAGFHLDDSREGWPRGPAVDPTMSTIDAVGHYPPAARKARQEGDVAMMLSIDAAGKVTQCDVTSTSMSAPLDAAACALLRSEGRFRPALDSNGKPVRGTLPATFQWVLPRDDGDSATGERPAPPLRKLDLGDPGKVTALILIDAEGRIADCKYESSGAAMQAPNLCDTIGGTQRYIPFVDADGRPVAKRIVMRASVDLEDADTTKPVAGQ